MARHSQQEVIAEALADMPKWRRKTAREFAGYAVLLAFMAVLLVAETWLFRHKIIHKFTTNPLPVILSFGVTIYAVVICVKAAGVLFSSRRDLLRAADAEAVLRREKIPVAGGN